VRRPSSSAWRWRSPRRCCRRIKRRSRRGSAISTPGFERFCSARSAAPSSGRRCCCSALSRRPIRAGEGWALRAALQSLLLWFVVDSVVSLANRAAFNVWMVNLPSLLALGIPLVVLRYRSNWSVAAQR
jgi:hypothetical protein